MMRSRTDSGQPRPSLYQHGTLHLLFREGSPLVHAPPREREQMIRALSPPAEAGAWGIVVSSRFREANENAARPAVNWLHGAGPAAG
eukprot:9429615-Alexandrium_andersonii.AAC.1